MLTAPQEQNQVTLIQYGWHEHQFLTVPEPEFINDDPKHPSEGLQESLTDFSTFDSVHLVRMSPEEALHSICPCERGMQLTDRRGREILEAL